MHGYQHFISLAIYDSKKHNASSDVIMPLNGCVLFLGFIEAMSFLKLFFLLVNIWNDNFTGKYLKLRYKTILCHFNVDIKICLKIQKKFESISMINYLCIIHLLYIYIFFFNQYLQRYPYAGCKLFTHQCESVGTKNSSFTEEWVSFGRILQSV